MSREWFRPALLPGGGLTAAGRWILRMPQKRKGPSTEATEYRVIVASRLLQLLGMTCLAVVVLTHVAEKIQIFPSMGWGLPDSPGHYLDLVSAILGCTLLLLGLLTRIAAGRK